MVDTGGSSPRQPGAPPNALRVRPPSPLERRAWRMLLPEAAGSPDPLRVLVALAPLEGYGPGPRIIGAIATSDRHRNAPIPWPRVSVHVVPPMRRRGVATALLHAAAAAERDGGLGRESAGGFSPIALAAWSLVPPGSEAELTWKQIGFTNHVTLAEHDVKMAEVEARLGPLYDQMSAGGWMPGDAQVIPLAAATPAQREQVAALHVAHLGGDARRLREQLSGRASGSFDADLSMVLLRAGVAVGFTLGGLLPDGVCSVDATVLDPAHRLGWANLVLKLTAARRLVARGVTTARFQSCDHHTDTRRTAQILGGVLKRQSLLMFRMFSAPDVPPGRTQP